MTILVLPNADQGSTINENLVDNSYLGQIFNVVTTETAQELQVVIMAAKPSMIDNHGNALIPGLHENEATSGLFAISPCSANILHLLGPTFAEVNKLRGLAIRRNLTGHLLSYHLLPSTQQIVSKSEAMGLLLQKIGVAHLMNVKQVTFGNQLFGSMIQHTQKGRVADRRSTWIPIAVEWQLHQGRSGGRQDMHHF